MKTILSLIAIIICASLQAQTEKIKWNDFIIDSTWERRCGVAHWNKDGIFTCDFNGTYYPAHIFDSTITKWFVKMYKGDSLFYYRNDIEKLYIWNGRPKNEEYGYEYKSGGGSEIIWNKYNGSDTLRVKEQVWLPK